MLVPVLLRILVPMLVWLLVRRRSEREPQVPMRVGVGMPMNGWAVAMDLSGCSAHLNKVPTTITPPSPRANSGAALRLDRESVNEFVPPIPVVPLEGRWFERTRRYSLRSTLREILAP